jgi:teichuronic acid biosynthesis glycosyltransferase TuaC
LIVRQLCAESGREASAEYRPKVLVISHLYPEEAFRVGGTSTGVFVREQMRALHNFCDLRIVIPCDCVPRTGDYRGTVLRRWWTQLAVLPKRFDDEGLKLEVVRFLSLPPRRHFLFGYGVTAFLPVLRRAQIIRRDFPFDLIHAHTTVPDGIVATWLGSIFGVPTVITSHQGDVELVPANRWNRATLRYTLSRADHVVAVSAKLKEAILALGIEDRKVTVIPNGFDPAKFVIDRNGNAKTLHNGSERVILFLGQLIPRKDPLIVVQSFSSLRERLPQVRLVMVGDGPLRGQVRDQVLHLGLSDCVDLVGEVPHSRVPEYLRSADLLCLPSHAEGWPTVIFEALSLGVPVIASRVGGIPEAITSEDLGLLVEPGDRPGLTEALYRGLTTAWDHTKIQRYAAEFTWGRIAERLHEEYRAVTAQTRISLHQRVVN